MTALQLPVRCSHPALLAAIDTAGLTSEAGTEILVDVPTDCFVHSAAIALLCSWGLLRIRAACSFRFRGQPDTIRYLARMDLLTHLGAPFDEDFVRHDATGRFIPIRLVTDGGASSGAAVQAVCDLVQAQHDDAAAFLPALRWSVAEILDNIANHAESPTPGVLCAQYFPKKNRIDVAVSDMGRGIKASLGGRFPRLYGHGEAITKALQAGVTRDLSIGQGNGLAGCVEIVAANGGDLHVWTGDSDLAYVDGRKKGFEQVAPLPGTGVLIRLHTDHPVDLRTTSIGGGSQASLHEVARVRDADEVRLPIAELAAHTEGRTPARELREHVLGILRPRDDSPGRAVTLDFSGVQMATSSFLDELLGRLAATLGRDDYEQKVGIAGMSDLLRGMTRKVVEQRLASHEDDQPSLAVAHDRVRRLFAPDSVVVVGEDPALASIAASFAAHAEVRVLNVPLDAGWRGGLANAAAVVAGRAALLLPAWGLAEGAVAETLKVQARSPIAEVVLAAWLDATEGEAAHAVLVPRNLLESQRAVGIRQVLWERDLVRNLTEFDCGDVGLPHVAPSLGLSLLELGPRREREAEHGVGFVDGHSVLTTSVGRQKLDRELGRLHGPFGERSEFGFRAVWAAAEDPLTRQRHDPDLGAAARGLENAGATTPLADLVDEWMTGVPIAGPDWRVAADGELRVIHSRDLASGLAARRPDELDGYELAAGAREVPRVRSGDLLVARTLDALGGGLRVAPVPAALDGAVAAGSVFVLRVSPDGVRDLLADYLRSDFAAQWLRARLAGSTEIAAAVLQELPVPRPDHGLAAIAGQLRATSRQLAEMSVRFEQARLGVFSIATINEQLKTLHETAARARLVAELVGSVDDVPATIRRTFPLPLAQGWRTFEAEVDPRRRYGAVLELFESTMVYLTVMTLADLRERAATMSKVSELLECFRTPERGPSLGQWIEAFRECPKLAPDRVFEDSAFPELRMLAARPPEHPYGQAVARLRGQRNDLAHGRGPRTERDTHQALAAAEADLRSMYEQLLFLSRYPLRIVETVEFDELEQRRSIGYRDLVGDHAIVPRREATVDAQVGHGLYVADHRGGLRLIGPWLTYGECPDCGHREVCAPEYWAPKGSGHDGVYFKSLTNGHMHPGRATDWARLARFVNASASDLGTAAERQE